MSNASGAYDAEHYEHYEQSRALGQLRYRKVSSFKCSTVVPWDGTSASKEPLASGKLLPFHTFATDALAFLLHPSRVKSRVILCGLHSIVARIKPAGV